MSDSKLFPLSLPVVVATGEYQSGKSMLALTTGAPIERVLVYDNEESVTTYHAMNPGFTRVDIAGQLPSKWTNLDFYTKWVEHVRSIEPGRYDVIAVDTIERIESGISDWVTRNPQYFGHSANQYERMSGLFWGDVKDLWGRHILELKARCQLLILTAHMRDVYVDRKPVPGKRERKGKETLSELASLEVELKRKPGQRAPSALVIKSRLVFGNILNPKTLRPMFDPYIPEFTWDVVREYMQKGADPEHPILPPEKTEEEKELEKLTLQAVIAQAKMAEPAVTQSAKPITGQFWPELNKVLNSLDYPFTGKTPKAKVEELAMANKPGWEVVLDTINSGQFDVSAIPV